MAQMILEAVHTENRRVTDLEVLSVLQAWAFKKNDNRQNVMPEGQRWGHSDTLGIVRLRTGSFGVTSATQEYPHVTQMLNTWLKARCPAEVGGDFPCTSISLNCNYAARRHRDGNNAGPSMIKACGNFTGGQLAYFPDDDRSGPVEDLCHDDRIVLDIKEGLALFDGCRGHEVDDFEGERFSLVFFSAGKFWNMSQEQHEFLEECGFSVPHSQDLGPVVKLLPPPRGYTKCQSLTKMFGGKERAKVFQWPEQANIEEDTKARALLSGFSAELEALRAAKAREAVEKAACDAAYAAQQQDGGAEEAIEIDVGEPAVEQERGVQKEPTLAEMPSVRFGPLDQVLGRKGATPAIPASATAESPSRVPVAAQSATVAGAAGYTALVAPSVRDRVPVLETPASPLPKLRGVSEDFPMGRLLLSAEKNKKPHSEVGDEEAPAWKRLREAPPKRREEATPVSCGVPIPAMEPTVGEGAEAVLTQVTGVSLGVEQQY